MSRWLTAELARLPKPLGIFAYSDYDASRVLGICREHGIDVPREVSILGVDNNPIICENQQIALSSVNHDLERVGYEGAALLDRLMQGEAAPERPVLIPPRGVTTRQSTDTAAVSDPNAPSVLFCVVSRKEIVQVLDIVYGLDPSAFVTISDAREVWGEGYQDFHKGTN